MTCDKCGQEVVECRHDYPVISPVPNLATSLEYLNSPPHLFCGACHHDFGPVRELIEAKEKIATLTNERDEALARNTACYKHHDHLTAELVTARARIAELEKERNEARKERDKAICDAGIAKSHADYLERASEVFGVRSFVVHANGTWEWRKG